MPNTPARIGQGITVWTATESVPEARREQARAILASFGQEVFVEDEHYLDMATALSGTGPAYVFMFMEALIDAGVHLGFSRRIAEQLVIQTMRGSVEYAAQSHEHPATLRNQVTSRAAHRRRRSTILRKAACGRFSRGRFGRLISAAWRWARAKKWRTSRAWRAIPTHSKATARAR